MFLLNPNIRYVITKTRPYKERDGETKKARQASIWLGATLYKNLELSK